jgi:hypothetical protein
LLTACEQEHPVPKVNINGNSHSMYQNGSTAHCSYKLSNPWLHKFTYESNKDAEELNDVSVSYTIQAAKQSVDDGDAGTEDDGRTVIHVDDDAERGACGTPSTIFKPEIF